MAVTGSRPRLVKAPTLKENQENALKLPEQYRTNDVFMSNFRKLMGSDTQDLVAQLINEGQVRAEIRPAGEARLQGRAEREMRRTDKNLAQVRCLLAGRCERGACARRPPSPREHVLICSNPCPGPGNY